MADERQAYTSRTWQTGDVITKQALNNIENEMGYVSAEINNAVTGTINDQKLNDTLARKLDSVVKYFPNTPNPDTDLEYVRMYAQPSTEGAITVPTEEEYLRFKQNFVQPFTNKDYVAGSYVEYEDEIYKVKSAIAKNNSAADDVAAWAAILAQNPSPVGKINPMEELNNLINVYTSDGQLTNEQNRIWIQQNGESVEVPTYEEFTSLSNSVVDLKSAFEYVTEPAINLYSTSNVVIGKNWIWGDASNRAAISIPVTGGETYTVVIPNNVHIPDVAVVRVNPYNASLGSQTINGGASAEITMESNCVEIRIQFQGNTTLASSDFTDYDVRVYEGTIDVSTAVDSEARQDILALETADTAIGARIDGISENAKNLASDETIEVGIAWTGDANAKRARMLVNVLPDTQYTIVIPLNTNVNQVNCIQKASRGALVSITSTSADLTVGTNTITTAGTAFCLILQFSNFTTDFTSAMFSGYVPEVYEGTHTTTARDDVARRVNQWEGKKLVWLGTSIPAAGQYQVDNPKSYPIMVGNMLGATVYNEAVGSSALHCKDPARISTANPYGFLANFEAVSRCITNSLTEMNWIIEHYNDSAVFTQNVPASLSDADKEFIRSCSWEIKLQKYFTEEAFPDAWVMDHGHNDVPTDASEALYTAKSPINGTQHDGYYNNGNFIPSTASSYLEYDVSGLFKVWISGTFGTYYDIYDLYDANGNNIGKRQNGGTETTVENFELDVMGATTLRVSNPNNKISTIAVNELTYPMYENVYCYQGALDFIVNKILTYNPKARILMIGEYENQKFPKVSENQETAAERWEFPLYRQWEKLGWSQQPILVNGEWKRMLNIIIPDNLHPHTDTTGFALELMANNICGWLLTLSN